MNAQITRREDSPQGLHLWFSCPVCGDAGDVCTEAGLAEYVAQDFVEVHNIRCGGSPRVVVLP